MCDARHARNRLKDGAGGGGRTRTRFESNRILSWTDGAVREGTKWHKMPPTATIAESAFTILCRQKPGVSSRSSTEQAQSAARGAEGVDLRLSGQTLPLNILTILRTPLPPACFPEPRVADPDGRCLSRLRGSET